MLRWALILALCACACLGFFFLPGRDTDVHQTAPSDDQASTGERDSVPVVLTPAARSALEPEASEQLPSGPEPGEPAPVGFTAVTSSAQVAFSGLVLDSRNAQPIEGVEVSTSEGSTLRTDAAGRFSVTLPERTRLAVSHAGFATTSVTVARGWESPEAPWVFRLHALSSLEGRVLDLAGQPVAGVEVALRVPAEESEIPPGMGGGVRGNRRRRGITDERGLVLFDELPSLAPIQVDLFFEESELVAEPERVTLRPGERRRVEWTRDQRGAIAGVVVDQSGNPVGDLRLLFAPRRFPLKHRRFTPSEWAGVRSLRTDELGRFRFEGLALGGWWVGPADQTEAYPLAQPVSLTSAAPEVERTFEVTLGLYIEGQILHADGSPVEEGQWVTAKGSATLHCESEEEGYFRLGPVADETYLVRAEAGFPGSSRERAFAPAVSARPGEPIVLRWERSEGASLAGRLPDLAGARAEVAVYRDSDGFIRMQGSDALSFRFGGLDAGNYHIIARSSDGRVGFVSDVELAQGEHRTGIALGMGAGARLRFVTIGTPGASGSPPFVKVFQHGALIGHQTFLREHLLWVPPGDLVVEYGVLGLERTVRREVTVRAGQEAEVELDFNALR